MITNVCYSGGAGGDWAAVTGSDAQLTSVPGGRRLRAWPRTGSSTGLSASGSCLVGLNAVNDHVTCFNLMKCVYPP